RSLRYFMLLKDSLQKYWHWLGLALLSALIGVTAFLAPSRVSHFELEREALVAEERILTRLFEDPQIVLNALTVPGAAPQLSKIFEDAGYATRVLRYELYDAQGRLVFTSGQASLELNDVVDVMQNPVQDGAVVGLYRG